MNYWEAAGELDQAGTPFVVVTMVSLRGHAPQDLGAKAIMTEEGLKWGTVGGGKVEARALLFSRELLGRAPRPNAPLLPELVTWNLQRDIGMTCGGEVTYLFELHRRDAWKIVVFGAGHVAQALVRALEPLRCQVTCIDPRAEWVEKLPQSSKLKIIRTDDPSAHVPHFSREAFFVVMTQGHGTDMPILEKLLRTFPDAAYLGSIGSDIKALKIRRELKERGFSQELVERLHCPIGLPLGGNDPAEIAVSIVAELIQVRDSLARA